MFDIRVYLVVLVARLDGLRLKLAFGFGTLASGCKPSTCLPAEAFLRSKPYAAYVIERNKRHRVATPCIEASHFVVVGSFLGVRLTGSRHPIA